MGPYPVELFLVLVIIAFSLIIVGFILLSLSSKKPEERRLRGGAIFLIGPIPIILGTDQEVAKGLVFLALILTLVSAVTFILILRAAG